MFLIYFKPSQSETEDGIAGLSSRSVQLSEGWTCQVYYDARQIVLSVNEQEVTLRYSWMPEHEIFRLALPDRQAVVDKPYLPGTSIYYSRLGQGLLISTRIRWLKALGVPLRENKAGLPEFFVYRYLTAPSTLFQDIFTLPLGASLRIDVGRDGKLVESLEWPKWFDAPPANRPAQEVVDLIREDLKMSVSNLAPRRDQVADLFSGGVDSSILYKLAHDHLGLCESHSSGYPFEDESTNVEKQYALSASKAFGSTHTYHEYSTDEYLSGLIQAVVHGETTLNHLQTVLFELMFRDGFHTDTEVIISGLGADAVFGLPVMYNYHRYRYLLKPAVVPLSRLAVRIVGKPKNLEVYSHHTWDTDFANPKNGLWTMGEYGDRRWAKQYFGVEDDALVATRMNVVKQFNVRSILDAFSILDTIASVSYTQDLWGKLAQTYGMTMYFPFNSPAMLKPVYALPWEAKLAEPKRFLREVGQSIGVPNFILTRPKRGFGVGAEHWAPRGGAFEPLVRLAAPVFGEDILRQFQKPDIKPAMTFWNLINYAVWKRIWIDETPAEVLQQELRAQS